MYFESRKQYCYTFPILTFAHRSLSCLCKWPFLTCWLVHSSPLSTGQWCRALREWYTLRNSSCWLGVQKWGIRSWRGKKYLSMQEEVLLAEWGTLSDRKWLMNRDSNINKPANQMRWLFQEDSHQDKNQVVGKGRDGYDHQRDGLDQVSAKLSNTSQVSQVTVRHYSPETLTMHKLKILHCHKHRNWNSTKIYTNLWEWVTKR